MVACKIRACSRQKKARGWCNSHYLRWWHYGDPHAGGPYRKRTKGVAEIGDRGALTNGYLRVFTEDGWILEHRLVMGRALKRTLRSDEQVHHRDGDKLNNELSNLELWVRHQPTGVRVEDAVAWAREILVRYGGNAA